MENEDIYVFDEKNNHFKIKSDFLKNLIRLPIKQFILLFEFYCKNSIDIDSEYRFKEAYEKYNEILINTELDDFLNLEDLEKEMEGDSIRIIENNEEEDCLIKEKSSFIDNEFFIKAKVEKIKSPILNSEYYNFYSETNLENIIKRGILYAIKSRKDGCLALEIDLEEAEPNPLLKEYLNFFLDGMEPTDIKAIFNSEKNSILNYLKQDKQIDINNIEKQFNIIKNIVISIQSGLNPRIMEKILKKELIGTKYFKIDTTIEF